MFQRTLCWTVGAMKPVIVVSIADPGLHPEVMHIAAATGCEIVDTLDVAEIARYLRTARAMLIDAGAADKLVGTPPRGGIYLLVADPGPVDWKAAAACCATDAFVIPAQSAQLLQELGRGDAQQPEASTPGHALGVIPVVGGAGASTCAVAAALRGGADALVDAVPSSGGIDLLVGIEEEQGARWGDVKFGSGRVDPESLLRSLPHAGDLAVLTHARSKTTLPPPRASETLLALESLRSKNVVVDLPRWGDDVAQVAAACTSLLLVVPAEVRAVSCAAAIVARLRAELAATPFGLVIRHRGWSGMDSGDVERIAGASVIGEIPTVPGMSKLAEQTGIAALPRALARATDKLLAQPGVWPC